MILLAGIFSLFHAQAQDTSASSLAAQLKTQYQLTKMSPNGRITDPGTVLVIQKDGLLGVPPASAAMCPATYKDGSLHPPATMHCGGDVRKLATGEKVYVLQIAANPRLDRVDLLIVECDSCNDAPKPASYKVSVGFQFPKGYLTGADVGQIEDVIAQLLAPESETLPSQNSASQNLTNDAVVAHKASCRTHHLMKKRVLRLRF
jgi:hypothetical protein